MKRIVSLMLCIALALACAPVRAAEEDYSSQTEKLWLQFANGSGVKGSVKAEITGDAAWASMLSPLSGVEFQFRAQDGRSSNYHYRLYVSDAGEMTAMTEMYSPDGTMGYIRSDFLTDTVLSFASGSEAFASLCDLGSENPTWYSVGLKLLLLPDEVWNASWAPQLEGARLMLDSYLATYASEPEMISVDGESRILIRFEIPADDIRTGMKALLGALLDNSQLMTLLGRQASDEQKLLYLHRGYSWYYEKIINELPLTGSVLLERQLTTKGEERSTMCILPIADSKLGLREIAISQSDGVKEVSLVMSDRTVSWSASGQLPGDMEGYFHIDRDEGKSLRVMYRLHGEQSATDDDNGRNHELYDWTLTAVPDLSGASTAELIEGKYVDFDEAVFHLNAHFYSKPGDTTPVTLKLQASAGLPGGKVQLTADLKSASPWHAPEAPQGRMVSLESLTAEERGALLNDWFSNGLLMLSVMRDAQLATDTDLTEATATDLAEGK